MNTNNPIETKVAAGGGVGLLLGLLFLYVPSLHRYVSPELAATLPSLIGAAAAYLAPHTHRATDQSALVGQVAQAVGQMLDARLRPAAPRPAAAPAPPAPAAAMAPPPPVPAAVPLQAGNVGAPQ